MTRCRSRSPFGDCYLDQRHPGDHMVAIILGEFHHDDPNDLWYGYTRRTQKPLGYLVRPRRVSPDA